MWLKSFLGLAVTATIRPRNALSSRSMVSARRWMWVDHRRLERAKMPWGMETNAQVAADMGTDFDDNIEELKREKELAGGILAELKQPTKVTNEQEKPDDEEK